MHMKRLSIDALLNQTAHRPFPYPTDKWAFYQEWKEVLFLHWKIPYDVLRKAVPENLKLDNFQGNFYVSLVPFSMINVRPRYLPSFPMVSDFHEINLRTYIHMGEKKGVYFLNIEAEKWISTYLSKTISGMPYEKSAIHRNGSLYEAAHPAKNYFLDLAYTVSDQTTPKNELDRWLTERYCLFLTENGTVFRFDVHHAEWEIKPVTLTKCLLQYRVGTYQITNMFPDQLHYSDGVQVIAWKRQLHI